MDARACRVGADDEGREGEGCACTRADEGPVNGNLGLIILREEHCGLVEENGVFTIWVPAYLIRGWHGINTVLRVGMMAGDTLTMFR